jgi:hypothetical protein
MGFFAIAYVPIVLGKKYFAKAATIMTDEPTDR